ncbi:HAL/PAL/TAL family ammonia-lyase [Nonomuraea diastatica]|uniref:Aromatic amino acid lyase n=1 Tax=Nonomuraea diastatica TaxID=1848329 RepID=A0A4R4WRD8_9ACTN|nr:aromatic amino acid ammonia-lyase [Nonomuraea diastatica]TDD17970.1 aromatic amino acid lyase [Nonomuraea diastatica]
MSVVIDGETLTADQIVRVARPVTPHRYAEVTLADAARDRLVRTRAHIETRWMDDRAPLMYGFNTGVGQFKDRRISVADMAHYQRQLIKAHATGTGEPFEPDVVRAVMLLRANALAAGFSGPSVEVVDRLLAFLNEGLHPVIPSKGSVGASGDLAPLSYLAAALYGFGEAEIDYGGRRLSAPAAISAARLPAEFEPAAKDASALLNGSTVSLALGVLAAHDARRVVRAADIALAMSLEAMRGELAAFRVPVHRARPHPGQQQVAGNVLRLAGDSRRCSPAARQVVFPEENRASGQAPAPRVQDVYSIRCAPQVHGPARDALGYIDRVLEIESNAATDNPLIFETDEGYEVISGGNFHGQSPAQAMDLLAIALTDLGSISERRLARLLDPAMSLGLPRNLNAGPAGVNTGYANVQCSMSALVMENRTLSAPGSIDSIPGKGNAEDHVSNSAWCARKARTVVDNVEQIVSAEMLMAAQALALVEPLAREHPLGRGTRAAVEVIRDAIPPALDGDRWFHTEMATVLDLSRSGAIIDAVEGAVGPLE